MPSIEQSSRFPVIVIGAGPIGLAAASHLRRRDVDVVVLEAGPHAGAGVAAWGHVRLFTPWADVVDDISVAMLQETGWEAPPPDTYPTGSDFLELYLRPLSETSPLRDRVRYGASVLSVSRAGRDKARDANRDEAPFELVVRTGGRIERVRARAVIDASGTTTLPNPLGSGGVPAAGEEKARDLIAYGVPDVHADGPNYASRDVLVVGSGHSAQNVILDLVRLKQRHPKTTIAWGVRGDTMNRLLGRGACDPIPQRARLGEGIQTLLANGDLDLHLGFEVSEVRREHDRVGVITTRGETIHADRIIASTGFRPDLEMLREVRLSLDPVLECPIKIAPLIDPRFHWCGSVAEHGANELAHSERDLFVVGMKSYGRAPTFLLKTGYAQVRSIAATLAAAPSSHKSTTLGMRPLIEPQVSSCQPGESSRHSAAFIGDCSPSP